MPSATNAASASISKSATARLAHNGADGPSLSRFTYASAHDTSFERIKIGLTRFVRNVREYTVEADPSVKFAR